jgi:hypothetical protein
VIPLYSVFDRLPPIGLDSYSTERSPREGMTGCVRCWGWSLAVILARWSIRTFSFSSRERFELISSWCPWTCTRYGCDVIGSHRSTILLIKSAWGVLAFTSSRRIQSEFNAALPSHPTNTWRGCEEFSASILRTQLIASNPVNSLRYELNSTFAPGTKFDPIIHCVPHADSMIHAAAAWLLSGRYDPSLIEMLVPQEKSRIRRFI